MKINESILAEDLPLPAIGNVMYQYVVAANGLFIRAEDTRLEALVKIAPVRLVGLVDLVEGANLKIDRVPGVWLRSVLASARRRMPLEAMYQFHYSGDQTRAVTHTWRCSSPAQTATPTALRFDDDGLAVVDLHSHNSMPAFFSSTDDADEQGLRFYCVIGRIDTDQPEIRCRVGVYGHFLDVSAETIFDDLGPFVDLYGEDDFTHPVISIEVNIDRKSEELTERTCRVCGCTDEHGCANGCFWVADDLCSNCDEIPPLPIPPNKVFSVV
ncbi:MAG: Mov34/MPN/PAD-1 family protein [Azonexus sp.]